MLNEELDGRVRALSAVTALPAQVTDEAGNTLMSCGGVCRYCSIIQRYMPEGETCEGFRMMAGRRAVDLGEAYLCSCHAGMCHIALPLLSEGAFEGAVLIGPFILGELDSTLIEDVSRRYPMPTDALLELYEAADSMRLLDVGQTKALLKLVYYLFEYLEGDAFGRSKRRVNQQRQIGESIHMYKGFQNAAPSYPYEKERALVSHVKAGDAQAANEVLNDLLGYALFSTGGELETVRGLTAELCALLSRAAIEGGVEADEATRWSRSFMRAIWQAPSIDDLCQFMQDAVERFCMSAFPGAGAGERASLKRATRYISIHFAEPLTLSQVASEAHLSESYFSTMFKRGTGASFRAYLSTVRVEEAKRLLAAGSMTVTEIALAVGFDSQSYFSKVFRSATGHTPREYRDGRRKNDAN